MNPLRFITRAFIDVFGITRPTPQQERRATWFISSLLTVILIAGALFFFFFFTLSHRQHP